MYQRIDTRTSVVFKAANRALQQRKNNRQACGATSESLALVDFRRFERISAGFVSASDLTIAPNPNVATRINFRGQDPVYV